MFNQACWLRLSTFTGPNVLLRCQILNNTESNPHLIAKQHLYSGNSTDVTIVNKVLSSANSYYVSVTSGELESINNIKPILIELENSVQACRDKVQVVLGQVKEVPISKPKVGIYVFTNILENNTLSIVLI